MFSMQAQKVGERHIMAEDIYEISMLLDFYGQLLTDSQYKCMDMHYNHDLSLSEIADEIGISRQGVHDLIKRCNKILEEYEEKLHLVERFLSVKEKVHKMNELLSDAQEESELIQAIREISGEIIEEL